MGQLEEEVFNTELIQPERQPTFDELVTHLISKGEKRMRTTPGGQAYEHFEVKMVDFISWVNIFKTYIINTDCIDYKLQKFITSNKHAAQWYGRWRNSFEYENLGSEIIKDLVTELIIKPNFNCEICYTDRELNGDGGVKLYNELYKVSNDIITILSMDHINLSRLTKTINNVETLSCDILSQGRELTDHRARLDQISEAIDNTTQDFIKHEKLHKSKDSEILKRVSSLETTTSNQYKYTSGEITNLDARLLRHRIKLDQISEDIDNTTQYFIQHEKLHTELHKRISSLETTAASTLEIKQVNKMLAEQNTILEVLSYNLDNNTQMEELLSFEYRKLNSIYLQMEDRVTQLETTQQLDIHTMKTYIINLTQRIENMTEREENNTEEINSKMKQMEDRIQDLTQYNEWVLLIIVCKLALISYLVYKVM